VLGGSAAVISGVVSVLLQFLPLGTVMVGTLAVPLLASVWISATAGRHPVDGARLVGEMAAP
jgi:hypothetical protein